MKIKKHNEDIELLIDLLVGALQEEGYEVTRFSETRTLYTSAYDALEVLAPDGSYFMVDIDEKPVNKRKHIEGVSGGTEEVNMTNLKGGNLDKFTVLKNDDIAKYLSPLAKHRLQQLLDVIYRCRTNDNKLLNTYLVINTDEPYADEVIEILKKNGHWG
ncbi:hypothetical protein [Sedimentibacter sp.]|uniref:hypothetical protein n=1 Tax=Sedimentibacter sp. TaxID=1960295 RepID=UPI0028AED3A4|nr:hypothetical protein [Sedimentibacter sp.]